MSIALMMAGQKSDSGVPITERVEDDFYPTDPEITRAVVRAEYKRLRRHTRIDEPCCGDGAICQVLKEFGLKYRATDLIFRGFGRGNVDFMKTKKFSSAVFTNPPYHNELPEKFIRHSLTHGARYLCLLLKEKYFYTQGRVDLFDEFRPQREYKICWRPDFLKLGGGTMDISWWVWDLDEHLISPRPLVYLLTKDGRCI